MPARILALPFALAALALLYLAWEVDSGYSVYLIGPVLVLALIYVLSPQINWWWYRRRPPSLDQPLQLILSRHHRFYQALPVAGKKRFRERVALYMINQEFMPQAMEEVPEDIKCAVAASVVQLTFGQDDFLLEDFERIVIYPRPFPSPQYPEWFHASETFEEDGVLLFSAEQLMRGFLQPRQFYHLGLHEFAKAYQFLHPGIVWPALGDYIWESLERISGFSREALVTWINLPPESVPARAVSISHFFVFPEAFREVLPKLYQDYVRIFGIDPAEEAGDPGVA